MVEPPADPVVVSAGTLARVSADLSRLDASVGSLGERLTHLEEVIKTSGINGHAAEFRILAELAPELKRRMNDPQMARLTEMVGNSIPTMEQFVTLAPEMMAAFRKTVARETFLRTLGLYFRPVRYVLNLILGAAITAAIFVLVNAVAHIVPGLP